MSADSTVPPVRVHPRVTTPRMGLRERKKQRTRRTIRTQAIRLFLEQGYAETTIEQIAEAADVSPSTFFRYFPSKEQLVLADDLDPIMIRLIEEQPPELSPLRAFKRAVIETFAALDAQERQFEQDRVKLIYSVPELRGAIAREMERTVDMVAGLVAHRCGVPADSLEARAFAGALTGALMTVIGEGNMFDIDRLTCIIDFLEAGMPLPHSCANETRTD